MTFASISYKQSRLASFLERIEGLFGDAEEAIHNPTTSQPGLDFGGLDRQTLDDLNEIVGQIRSIQLYAESMLALIESHLATMGIRLVEDLEENDCLSLGYIAHADGRRVLPPRTRQAVAKLKRENP